MNAAAGHPDDDLGSWGLASRGVKAMAVVDVVESVRLTSHFEHDFIARWQAAIRQLRQVVLPAHGGQLVSVRGDGLILAFDHVAQALAALQALRRFIADGNRALDPERHIRLRAGVDLCEVLIDAVDAYGSGVNVAARLAAHGEPDQTLVTAEANAQLHPAIDSAAEDLGELWFKHLDTPVRAYRIDADSPAQGLHYPPASDAALRPTLAIVPFAQVGQDARGLALGELVADELICALSVLPEMRVVSRLSTRVIAGRGTAATASAQAQALAADYVLTGTCHLQGERVLVHCALHDGRSDEVLQVWRQTAELASLLADESPLVQALVAQLGRHLLQRQIELARRCALPNLAGYTLLLSGITLMHRLARSDIQRAHDMLAHLCDRWPRLAAPQAWKARWHLFSVLQGTSADPARDRALALQTSERALELDPLSSVALAVAGSVRIGLTQDVDAGVALYNTALDANPNDSFAWMLLGTAHAFKGEGHDATRASEQAARLSPLDPMHFMYDCHAAAAALAADDNATALRLAERSLRANSQHLSTLRVLALAQMLQGQPDAARASIARLRSLDPRASVEGWLRNSASAAYPIGKKFAELLGQAGLPLRA